MTVTSTVSKNQYTANGSLTTFAYSFLIFSDSDLAVYVDDVLKTLTTDYTVTNAGVAGGGNVVFGTAPADTKNVTIIRSVPYTQSVDYTAYDPFPAETHESALDRNTMLSQQLLEKHERGIKMKPSFTGSEVLVDAPSAGKALKWNSAGTALENSTDDIDGITSSASASAAAAAASATAAATSETNAASSATSAAADLATFQGQYHGASATDPTTGLDTGDLYFSTADNVMKTYTGSAWVRIQPTTTEQGHINTVSGISSDVTTVSGISGNVTTVAGISGNVTTVANDETDIGHVAGQISPTNNIGTVATNASSVSTTATNIANVNTTAGSISNVNTVAGSIADVNRYANEYTIASSAPGSPSSGDLWYDSSSTNQLKYYNGSAWVAIAPGITSEDDPAAAAMALALGS